MSRSYKKHSHYCGTSNRGALKRMYSRRMRRTTSPDEVSDGNHYRKFNNSSLMNDYCGSFGEDYRAYRRRHQQYFPEDSKKEIRRYQQLFFVMAF